MIPAKRPTLFPLPVAGWKEHVTFPRLKLGPLVAKLDTGARTAALHADEIKVTGKRVRFMLLMDGKEKAFKAPLIGHKRIKSSNGHSELRPVIRATLELGVHVFKTEITLTDRTDMEVPMLLGRDSIKGHFIVNPARTFLLRTRKKSAP